MKAIKKLEKTRAIRRPPKQPALPESDRGLFVSGPPLRRMRVVFDEAAREGRSGDEQFQLLLGLLSHPYVMMWRYADEGPPEDMPRRQIRNYATAVDGWVVAEEASGLAGHLLTYSTGEGVGRRACVAQDYLRLAERDVDGPSLQHLSPEEGARRRRADALAVRVAAEMEADIFISDRPYVHEGPKWLHGGTTVLRPEEALPLVGLYLRRQQEFIVWRTPDGTGTSTFNRGLLYWVATRALLPESWRWATACARESEGTGDDTLVYHAQSLLQRVDQALRARDDAFVALSQPQDNDTADDALAALDRLLISLMGAVDVSARVAHFVHELQGDEYLAGWQRPWVKNLSKHNEALAQLAACNQYGDALTVLRLLRNTIHGSALTPLAVVEGPHRGPVDTVVALPAKEAEKLLASTNRIGGHEAWGIRELIPGSFHFDIDVLIEQLLPRIIAFLNAAMKLTPVEQLKHVALEQKDALPPTEARSGEFSEVNQRLVLWQMGLS